MYFEVINCMYQYFKVFLKCLWGAVPPIACVILDIYSIFVRALAATPAPSNGAVGLVVQSG